MRESDKGDSITREMLPTSSFLRSTIRDYLVIEEVNKLAAAGWLSVPAMSPIYIDLPVGTCLICTSYSSLLGSIYRSITVARSCSLSNPSRLCSQLSPGKLFGSIRKNRVGSPVVNSMKSNYSTNRPDIDICFYYINSYADYSHSLIQIF